VCVVHARAGNKIQAWGKRGWRKGGEGRIRISLEKRGAKGGGSERGAWYTVYGPSGPYSAYMHPLARGVAAALGPCRHFQTEQYKTATPLTTSPLSFLGARKTIGVAAPIVGYGALNAILYVAYNRSLTLLGSDPQLPTNFWHVWTAGAIGGLATFVVSAPTEVIKCRVQVSDTPGQSSWTIAKELWRRDGIRGLYWGGGVTSVRDSVGYGFYFWTYELCKQSLISSHDSQHHEALKVLLCGGIAGIATWASIFPLGKRLRISLNTPFPCPDLSADCANLGGQ